MQDAVLANNGEELRRTWLDGLRQEITVENLLAPAQEVTGGNATGGAVEGENTGGAEQLSVPNNTEMSPPSEDTQEGQ